MEVPDMVDAQAGSTTRLALIERLAKVFADPARVKILVECNKRIMSPSQFFEKFGGGSLTKVARHFRVLVKYEWLELVETKTGGRRRGGVEHLYRATQPALFDRNTWPGIPMSLRKAITAEAFETYAERVLEAMEADTIDARDDRHFSWTAVLFDQLAWENVIARMDALFEFMLEEQANARIRLAETGEEPIPATIAFAGFESPLDAPTDM
jgi:hypothetical protein